MLELKIGDQGDKVKELQQHLIAGGYNLGASGADGDFGQATYDAVRKFQSDHGLAVDGVVGTETATAILCSLIPGVAKLGSTGELVEIVQGILIKLGYNLGPSGADGDFGQATYDAVIKFQMSASISADGVVGPMTFAALFRTILNGNLSSEGGALLKLGSKGDSVKTLQTKLISRGYNVGADGADGDFGYDTYKAVVKFQADRGLEQDGVVGPATWSMLNGVDNSVMLKIGSKGDAVKRLQERLIAKGYNIVADGDFGDATRNAVLQLQATYGLEQDGVVGPLTWDALGTSTYSDMLKLGAKGNKVKELQSRLIALGYNLGPSGADGDFGQATYDAVIRFQADNNLAKDGVVGQETWNGLYGTTPNGLLRLGSKGDAVKRLQEKLNSKGYSLAVDGDFGQATYDAVVKFQSGNGLEVDGVVGTQTWNALYGFNNGTSLIGGSAGVGKFLNVARAELGTKEDYDNITKYGAWYGNNGAFWCAQFVSWCANQAGILGSIVPTYQSCRLGASWYMGRGRYRTRISGFAPLPGDIIFFRNSYDGWYHTGIVESVSGGMVNTIEGNSGNCVRRQSYSLTYGDIDGYGLNGGIISDNDDVLKEAGNVGMFKYRHINFPGYSVEVPLKILSLMPAITVSAKVSRQPVVYDGKTYQVQSTAPRAMTHQITDGLTAAGVEIDFNGDNLADTLQSLSLSLTAGDVLKYEFALKPYGAIEISIELKVKSIGEDVYQAIIVRIERGIGPNQSIRLPIIVKDAGRAEVASNEPYYAIIGGICMLALGGAAFSGVELVTEGVGALKALIML